MSAHCRSARSGWQNTAVCTCWPRSDARQKCTWGDATRGPGLLGQQKVGLWQDWSRLRMKPAYPNRWAASLASVSPGNLHRTIQKLTIGRQVSKRTHLDGDCKDSCLLRTALSTICRTAIMGGVCGLWASWVPTGLARAEAAIPCHTGTEQLAAPPACCPSDALDQDGWASSAVPHPQAGWWLVAL